MGDNAINGKDWRPIPVNAQSLDKRDKFFDCLLGGMSNKQACLVSGISEPTGRKWIGLWEQINPEIPLRRKTANQLREERIAGPKRVAKLATEDFAMFQERYLGKIAVPWQTIAADTVVKLWKSPEQEFLVLNAPPGSGKAVALDEPILTTKGWSTIGALRVGEYVYDENGLPTKVLAKSEIFEDHDCYEVQADDGTRVVVNAAHEWNVRLHGTGQYKHITKPDYPGKTGPKPKNVNGIATHETRFLAKPRSKRPQLQMADVIQSPPVDLPIDPYVLGAWLGDGDSSCGAMTSDPPDAKFVRYYFEQAGYRTTDRSIPTRFGVLGLQRQLRALGVLNNKHVPEAYLLASPDQRRALLQGLIDSDGHVSPTGHVEFCNKNKQLSESVQYLVHSLGAKASLKASCARLYGKDCGTRYRVNFYLKDSARLPRKALLTRDGARTPSRYLTVRKVKSRPTQCIQVQNPTGLFLIGRGLLVTHNSSLLIHDICAWIISQDRSVRICVLSSTKPNAVKFANQLRMTLSATAPTKVPVKDIAKGLAKDAVATMSEDFGPFEPEDKVMPWSQDKFRVDIPSDTAKHKENTVEAYGKDQAILGGRWDIVILDDYEDPTKIKSADKRQEMKEFFDNIVQSRLEPSGLLIINMQRVGPDDISRYALDMKAADAEDDDSITEEEREEIRRTKEELGIPPLPIRDGERRKYHHLKFQAHDEAGCKGSKFHKADAAPWPEGCLLYPRRLSYRLLMDKKLNKPEQFLTWYQQEDVQIGDSLVRKEWIEGGTDEDGIKYLGCWDDDRSAQELPRLGGEFFSVLAVDPSPRNYWGIVWGIYSKVTKCVYIMDIERRRLTEPEWFKWNTDHSVEGVLPDMVEKSIEIGAPIQYFIPEQNVAQKLMWENTQMRDYLRSKSIQTVDHTTHAHNKNALEIGVQSLAGWFRDGRIRLPGKQRDALNSRTRSYKLVDEVLNYRLDGSSSKTTDVMMALWFITHKSTVFERPKLNLKRQYRPQFTQPNFVPGLEWVDRIVKQGPSRV